MRATGGAASDLQCPFGVSSGFVQIVHLIPSHAGDYAQGVVPVGDCEGGTNLYDATHTAYFGALRVL